MLLNFHTWCIDEARCGFVPRCLISDNIITAYELLHLIKNRRVGQNGSFALKFDMSKAYDIVEWQFFEEIMLNMGFSGGWVNRIMRLVSSVSYSIVVNGVFGERFISYHGLRQGDLLSPYMFLICGEGLSAVFRVVGRNGRVLDAQIARNSPCFTHLLFADDFLILLCYLGWCL